MASSTVYKELKEKRGHVGRIYKALLNLYQESSVVFF